MSRELDCRDQAVSKSTPQRETLLKALASEISDNLIGDHRVRITTPSAQPDGTFNDSGQGNIRIIPRPTDRQVRMLFLLVSQLQRGLDRHDQELRNAYLTAPEPVRQELRIAHRETQRKYLGLIQAMSMVARGSDLPAFEGTLQSGR